MARLKTTQALSVAAMTDVGAVDYADVGAAVGADVGAE